MVTTSTFVRRFLRSWVSIAAVVTLAVGLIVAGISFKSERWWPGEKGAWWSGYLQSLSTSLIGIACTVWVISLFSELQNHRQAAEARATNEIAAFVLLSPFIGRLSRWLPNVQVPNRMTLAPLQLIQNEIEHMGAVCEAITPGIDDPELQSSLDGFRLRRLDCSELLAELIQLIETDAPEAERERVLARLQPVARSLLSSAGILQGELAKIHDFRKLKLGIAV